MPSASLLGTSLLALALLVAEITLVGGPRHPDGTEVDADLPADRHQRNAAGRDGAGLCVFTAIGMAADWAHERHLVDFRDYMRQHPGGGYPEKVTTFIRRLCAERGQPEPLYLQVQGHELELLAEAVAGGHLPCVTYGQSPTGRYQGQPIAHMVNLVAARAGTQRLWAILDNNFPGTIEWMTEAEFHRAYTRLGTGWAVILLGAGPPPIPWNR
ncbi:MAG TPA: hypothetical protein PKC45_13860 [Gemmatales bacterium]|nr:hypothetical protein [Gemmatales bacterium]